jgi:carboxymethylenebutenolidase
MGETVTFKRPDGGDCSGYCAEPDAGRDAPGVVVIQEWWGVDDNIRSVADRLAKRGYCALVPDIYRGKVALDAAEAAHLMSALDFQDAAAQDLRGAVQHLKQRSSKVAAMGFCMGGALSILVGIHVPEVDAISCWYGVPPPEAGDPKTIRVAVQGHFSMIDTYFPPSVVDALEAKLSQAGVPHDFHRYAAAHGFANTTAPYYDPQAAELAWQRSFAFLAQHCS